MTDGKKIRNALFVVGFIALISAIITANLQEQFRAGTVYTLFGLVTFVILAFKDKLGINPIGIEFGKGTDWIADVFFAGIVTIVYIGAISTITGLSLGIPSIPLSAGKTEKILIVGFIAPIIEELFFRSALFSILARFGTITAFLGQSVLFMLAHLFAYTQGFYTAVTVPFIGALMFGLLAQALIISRGNALASIVPHIAVNNYLISKLVIV